MLAGALLVSKPRYLEDDRRYNNDNHCDNCSRYSDDDVHEAIVAIW